MKIKNKYLLLFVFIFATFTLICGCEMYQPRQTPPNYPVTPSETNQGMLPNDMQGNRVTPNNMQGDNLYTYEDMVGQRLNMNGNIVSAEFQKSDVGYVKINATNCNVRSGCGTNFPKIATLNQGNTVKVLGKLNNFYIVQMPNSNKVGCVSADLTSPYSSMSNVTKTPPQIPSLPKTTVTPSSQYNTTNNGAAMSDQESRILQLCNAERQKNALKALKSNMDLTKLARLKSDDMVKNNYFDHQSPTYGSPFDMLKKYGVSYMYAGENIALNQNADAAFKAWMNSEGHRKNILNPNFTELGVGIAQKSGASYVYTQMFIGK